MATGDSRQVLQLTDLKVRPVNDILRVIQEGLRYLEGRLGKVALRDSVTVAGNVAVSGNCTATPIYGKWANTVYHAGAGNYIFDYEIKRNSTYFTMLASGAIQINVAGTYLLVSNPVVAGLAAGARCDLVVDVNTVRQHWITTTAAADGVTTGVLVAVLPLAARDSLTIGNGSGDRSNDVSPYRYSNLALHLLN